VQSVTPTLHAQGAGDGLLSLGYGSALRGEGSIGLQLLGAAGHLGLSAAQIAHSLLPTLIGQGCCAEYQRHIGEPAQGAGSLATGSVQQIGMIKLPGEVQLGQAVQRQYLSRSLTAQLGEGRDMRR
jgi:hypothetical protein